MGPPTVLAMPRRREDEPGDRMPEESGGEGGSAFGGRLEPVVPSSLFIFFLFFFFFFFGLCRIWLLPVVVLHLWMH